MADPTIIGEKIAKDAMAVTQEEAIDWFEALSDKDKAIALQLGLIMTRFFISECLRYYRMIIPAPFCV